MKATIDEHGILTVNAESALESYALNVWADKHFVREENVCYPPGAQRQDIPYADILLNTGFEKKA